MPSRKVLTWCWLALVHTGAAGLVAMGIALALASPDRIRLDHRSETENGKSEAMLNVGDEIVAYVLADEHGLKSIHIILRDTNQYVDLKHIDSRWRLAITIDAPVTSWFDPDVTIDSRMVLDLDLDGAPDSIVEVLGLSSDSYTISPLEFTFAEDEEP